MSLNMAQRRWIADLERSARSLNDRQIAHLREVRDHADQPEDVARIDCLLEEATS